MRAIAARLQVRTTDVERVLAAFIAELREHVWVTGRISIPHLGTFKIRRRKKRLVRDPVHPGEQLALPAHRVVAFRASKDWRSR